MEYSRRVRSSFDESTANLFEEMPFHYVEKDAHSSAESSNARTRYRRRKYSKRSALIARNISVEHDADSDDDLEAFVRIRDFVLNDNRERLGEQNFAANTRQCQRLCHCVAEYDLDSFSILSIGWSDESESGWLASAEESSDESCNTQLWLTARARCYTSVSSDDAATHITGSASDPHDEDGDSDETSEDDRDGDVHEGLQDDLKSDCAYSDITIEEGQENMMFQPLRGQLISIAHVLNEQHQRAIALAKKEADQRLRRDFKDVLLSLANL